MDENRRLTIGLEIHAELKTRTKMFCACLNNPDEKQANVNICPVCVGHPGTLPVTNKRAVEQALKLGMALQGTLFPKGRSKFDRKSYFYPDLPKGYQISQYDEPLVQGGALHDIRIRRIHLEEDAGSLIHNAHRESPNQSTHDTRQAQNASFVNFNRAGTPLMELVTEPDITNADQAVAFAQELQRILRYLGISDADMERGLMRLEANISINTGPVLNFPNGVKVEVKNINSFKALYDAITYEYERQTRVLAEGKKIAQETCGWNQEKKATVSQRNKEGARDYRYFPEPDLPPIYATAFDMARLKQEIPELPAEKRRRFMEEYGLGQTEADILAQDREAAEFFEESASELALYKLPAQSYQLLCNYFTSDLWGIMKKENKAFKNLRMTPAHFALLLSLIAREKIGSRAAKDILAELVKTGGDPETIMKEKGLEQTSHAESLEEITHTIIQEHPQAVEDYKKGKTASLQFLIGKAMAAAKGTGNPKILKELFEKLLS